MTPDVLAAASVVLRLVAGAGFVLWAGPLVLWAVVWPTGHRQSRLARLSQLGVAVLIAASLAEPAVRLAAGQPLAAVAPPLVGSALLVRLAVAVGSVFFLPDLVASPVVGRRRVLALAAVVVVAVTMAVAPVPPAPGLTAVAVAAHLIAAAAWLGGLVAVAVVVRQGGSGEVDGLVRRFSPVAVAGLVGLVLASALAVVATAIRPVADDRPDAWLLLVRLGLLVLVLLLAWYAQRATARLAFRRLFGPGERSRAARDRALAVVVGAELAIAVVTLGSTALVGMAA